MRDIVKGDGLRKTPPARGLLCPEDKAGSDCGADHLVGHFGPHQVIKSLPSTMARYQIIRIDLLKSRDDLPDVLVGQRRHHVEAANDRMDLLDAGSGLCLSDRIDDAAAPPEQSKPRLEIDERICPPYVNYLTLG